MRYKITISFIYSNCVLNIVKFHKRIYNGLGVLYDTGFMELFADR